RSSSRSTLPSLSLGIGASGFNLGPNADGLAKAHIEGELGRTCAGVDGNQSLAGDGNCVKGADVGLDNTRPRQVSGKGRPVIEDGVAIQVLAGNDVKRRSRIGYQEWTDAEAVRQGHVSKEKQASANGKDCMPRV